MRQIKSPVKFFNLDRTELGVPDIFDVSVIIEVQDVLSFFIQITRLFGLNFLHSSRQGEGLDHYELIQTIFSILNE